MNNLKSYGAPHVSMLLGAYETSFDKRTFNIDGFDSEIKNPEVIKEYHPPILSHQLSVLENRTIKQPIMQGSANPETKIAVHNSHIIVVAVITTLATLFVYKMISN